jgi:GT2 family glycosyltransferase
MMSQSASEVSVVTVNWNGRKHLEKLLPSLMAQSCLEIIVVDNGSLDGSVEFLRDKYPDVRILQNSKNRGFAQPCNWAAEAAQGKFVSFINNDMKADPLWIQKALERITNQCRCVASRILDWQGDRIDFNGSSLQYLGYALQQDAGKLLAEVSDTENQILFPCGGAMLIDRDYFLGLGGFDGDFFAIYEDVDLGWRIWLTGSQVLLAEDSVVYHRGHSTFEAHPDEKTRYLMHRNALLTVVKNYEQETLRKVLPLAIVLGIKRAVLLSGASKESFYLWENARWRLSRDDPNAAFQLMDALNHLVALDDVLDHLPETLRKREQVQRMRSREDKEIFSLFRDPFRTIVDDPAYRKKESELLEFAGLDSVFDRKLPQTEPDALVSAMEKKLSSLRKELAAAQWMGNKVQRAHPNPGQPGVVKFLNVWRNEGLKAAWQSFVEYIHRGI